ncbi:MAG TPA: 1-phosphofructokinase [Bacillota bacterium]
MIITVNLNPAVDKTIEVRDFKVGTVNRVSALRMDAGGKGINVSKVILSLGGKSKAIGVLAGTAGTFIKDCLNQAGIESNFYFIKGETRTNLKIIDYTTKTTTDINEPGPNLTNEALETVKRMVFNEVNANTIVIFSGSVPNGVAKDIYGKWILAAKQAGAKTILDADGELLQYGIAAGPFLVKPNLYELEGLFGIKVSGIEEIHRLANSLLSKYGIEIVVVSLGEKGAIFVNHECSLLADGIKVDVKSTVGAGDSMVAALAYAIDHDYDFEKAAKLAVASGTANVTTPGTQAADYKTIVNFEKQVTLTYL